MRKNKLFLILLVFAISSVAYSDLMDDFNQEPKRQNKPKEPDVDTDSDLTPHKNKKNDDKKDEAVKNETSSDQTKSQETEKKKKTKKKPFTDTKIPIKINSEGASAIRDDGVVELMKNVAISQGDLVMTSDNARVFFNQETDEVDKVVAEGKVYLEKIDPNTQKKIKAKGNKITYLNDEQKVVLEGKARLFRGDDVIKGNRIIYDLKTGWIKADKVQGVLYPDEKK